MIIWFQLANVRLTNPRPTLASLAAPVGKPREGCPPKRVA